MDVKRTERGWSGHFCGSSQCAFRRNTLLEFKNIKIVVSTVGSMRKHNNMGGFDPVEKIGLNRYYETMVFEAIQENKYIEADIEKEMPFDSKWEISKIYDGVDNEANDMHEAVITEIIDKYG